MVPEQMSRANQRKNLMESVLAYKKDMAPWLVGKGGSPVLLQRSRDPTYYEAKKNNEDGPKQQKSEGQLPLTRPDPISSICRLEILDGKLNQ